MSVTRDNTLVERVGLSRIEHSHDRPTTRQGISVTTVVVVQGPSHGPELQMVDGTSALLDSTVYW